MKTYYMHTMDGRPAVLQRMEPQKPWLAFVGRAIRISDMATSLRQLRHEQESVRYDPDMAGDVLGYIRVRL